MSADVKTTPELNFRKVKYNSLWHFIASIPNQVLILEQLDSETNQSTFLPIQNLLGPSTGIKHQH